MIVHLFDTIAKHELTSTALLILHMSSRAPKPLASFISVFKDLGIYDCSQIRKNMQKNG